MPLNDKTVKIEKIAFLTPGNYAADNPYQGLEETLQLFELGEELGFNNAWVRQRHLEPGVSSASVFLSAAAQRTKTIEIGSAVIQLGYESPPRLAEDLATVDVLSRGRLNVGLSTGVPLHADLLASEVFEGDWKAFDFSHERVLRLARYLDGHKFGDESTFIKTPFGDVRPQIHPHAQGLTDRLWYGGGSLRSAGWAADHGFNLLIGNLTSGEDTDDFYTAQINQINTYLSRHQRQRVPRIALGRVIVPTDSADAKSRQRYQEFAASRYERTLAPQGPRRTLFNPDQVGSSDEILENLLNDPVLPYVSELRLELPYEFHSDEYRQIISDFTAKIAPVLGWNKPVKLAA